MPDYKKSKIYKIVCDTSGEVYYGSTIQSLSMRLTGHRQDAKRHYCSSKQIIDRGNYSIVLVEEYPCENKEQLCRRERYYIENNVCVNKEIPTRTMKEYREDNKEKIKEISREYREDNKERIKEWQENNKEKIKEYRVVNKERINQKQRERRAKKKADALEQQL